MERLDRKRLLAGAGVGAAGLLAAPAVAGAGGDDRRHPAEGTWLAHVTGTLPDGTQLDAFGMGVYLRGGVALEIASITPAPSYGAWKARSRRRFRARFRRFRFTAAGAPAGFEEGVLNARVDADGDSFRGQGLIQGYDQGGAAVGTAVEVRLEATRFTVD
ncbi:MAG: hypothetical protein AVDCRST_MAG79-888 [uncultured Thermoleophilia bacterium]|uniref:Uncharacterized protein n=1 Tax=uncultured Thermoleophilia bacterium TaxID=1497501 RepID=A0A6J4TTS3_9ACTN|nr:MAG: hypothetical protein AVDCRST_MAG79-888 [uncultured Thermoleophilia bacterium]